MFIVEADRMPSHNFQVTFSKYILVKVYLFFSLFIQYWKKKDIF